MHTFYRHLLLALLLACPLILFSQGYTIKNYDVQMDVHTDGSVDVVETIDVNFSESRRGIIRNIPVTYKNELPSKSEVRANRDPRLNQYRIVLEEVTVDDNPFVTYEDRGSLNIRIGDASVYLTGNKRYVIRYTVWGALNDFNEWIEFTWNAIPTQWDTRIDKASFAINFDKDLKLEQDDVIALGGKKGSKEDVVEYQLSPKSFAGKSKRKLKAREGISAAVKIPPSYFTRTYIDPARFASQYVINKHTSRVKVLEDASLEVIEQIEVNFIHPTFQFTRKIEGEVYNPALKSKQYLFIQDEEIRADGGMIQYAIQRDGPYTSFTLRPAKGRFEGIRNFTLTYKIFGPVFESGDGDKVNFDFLNYVEDEPVSEAILIVETPMGSSIDQKDSKLTTENGDGVFIRDAKVDGNTATYSYLWDARHLRYLQLNLKIDGVAIDYSKMPIRTLYKDFLIKDYQVNLDLSKGSGIDVTESYIVESKYPNKPAVLRGRIMDRYTNKSKRGKAKAMYPSFNLLGPTTVKALDDYTVGDEISTNKTYNGVEFVAVRSDDTPVLLDYRLDGLVGTKGSKKVVRIELAKGTTEPTESFAFNLKTKSDLDASMVKASLHSGTEVVEIPLENIEGGISGVIEGPMSFNSPPWFLELEVPGNVIQGYSLWERFKKFRTYNMPLLTSIVLSIFIFFAWFFYGRDLRWDGKPSFSPPDDMTPATAGFIWDGKLHKRDLIALIYYWAANGILRIEETEGKKGKTDYRLVKLNELPSDSKAYEKVLFKGIFKGLEIGETMLVSDTRDKLYADMKKAHRTLMKSKEAKSFYKKGTRAAGTFMIILGVFFLFASLILMGIAVATHDYSYAVPGLLLSVVLIVFGRIMPRMTREGSRQLHQLLGFKSFIKTSSLDELQKLYDKDSDYFNKTLAYAIVMGLGKEWGERFKDIAVKPPDYYRPKSVWSDYTTIILVDNMTRSMRRMNSDFNYVKPAQSSGSWSSGSSSWGGGGGSSFGGGFSSGGGFGGGGGSAW